MTNDDKYEYRHANGSRFCHPKGDPRYVAPDAGTAAGGIDAEMVAQVDREAAAKFGRYVGRLSARDAQHILDGTWDVTEDVQSFARHRALARQSLPSAHPFVGTTFETRAERAARQSLPVSGEVERAYRSGYVDSSNDRRAFGDKWGRAFVDAVESAWAAYKARAALTPVTSHADAGEWVPDARTVEACAVVAERRTEPRNDDEWWDGYDGGRKDAALAIRNLSPRASSSKGE